MTTLIIPGPVVPKERPRVVNGHAYTPSRTRVYEKAVRILAGAQWREPLAGPVEVEVCVWMPDYRRRDLDNCVKAITDALNGIAYADDSQIVRLVATKGVDREYPRAFVKVQAAAMPVAKPEQEAA